MARFTDDLKSIGFGSYADYLSSPLWASIRSRVYASKGRMCLDCKTRRATQIHHRQYDLDTLKGDTLNYLIPICRQCHRAEHGLETPQTVAPIVIPWNPNQRCPSARKPKRNKEAAKKKKKRGNATPCHADSGPTAPQLPPSACVKCKRLVKRRKLNKETGMCDGCEWSIKQVAIREHNKALIAKRQAAKMRGAR